MDYLPHASVAAGVWHRSISLHGAVTACRPVSGAELTVVAALLSAVVRGEPPAIVGNTQSFRNAFYNLSLICASPQNVVVEIYKVSRRSCVGVCHERAVHGDKHTPCPCNKVCQG